MGRLATMPAPRLPVTSAEVGGYRLGKRLDDGAGNETYEAFHPGLSRRLTIELLRRGDPRSREACRHDAELVGGCAHPNIAALIGTGVTPDGVPFLVREYVDGETLVQVLARRGPMPVAEVARMVAALAAALGAAHGVSVIHGQLRPGKIFLQRAAGYPGGFVRVVDFGLWRLGGQRRSPHYTAPELLVAGASPPPIDARSDQFSLAAIAYRMIAGVDPFPGDDPGAVAGAILHGVPRPLDSLVRCDVLVGAVIRRGLSQVPALRFDTVEELASALRDAVHHRTPEIAAPIVEAQFVCRTTAAAHAADGTGDAMIVEQDQRPAYPGRRRSGGRTALLITLLLALGGAAWWRGWRLPAGAFAAAWADVTGTSATDVAASATGR
jgi:serine/threonine protein kinase